MRGPGNAWASLFLSASISWRSRRPVRQLKQRAEFGKVCPSAARSREETMANKDKGGAKDKKAASKTLKEKREAKRAKGKGSDRSSSSGR
jgi:hypothetical protein